MGWTRSSDMKSQIKLTFDTKEEAIAYAERNGFPIASRSPSRRPARIVSYADNFKTNRIGLWTH